MSQASENEAKRQELIARTSILLERLVNGCRDGSCDINQKQPGSMVTNGGCKCWRYMPDDFLNCALIADSLPRNKRCY